MAKITYGITPTLSHLSIIAKHQNLFKKRNLDIEFRSFLTGRKAMQALHKGWIDIANVIDANVAVLAQERKNKVKLLSCTQTRKDGMILARADNGITTPQSLYGKRLGYMQGTSSHMFIQYFCRHHELDLHQFNLVPVKTDQMEKALLTGEIDACSVWQPFTTHIKLSAARADINIVQFKNNDFFELYVILGANRKALKSKAPQITAIEDALKEALAYSVQNPDECQEILAQALDMRPELFLDLQRDITLCYTDIDRAFWDQVQIHLGWLNATPNKSYENFIDSLTS